MFVQLMVLLLKRAAAALTLLIAAVTIALVVATLQAFPDPLPTRRNQEQQQTRQNVVDNISGLYSVQTQGIIEAHTEAEIIDAVRDHARVSIGGGRNSMGGQTASPSAVQIDLRAYNHIINFLPAEKLITVEAGIRWRDIQDYIDPYDLSVQIMQSYANFTVGGSLSVNVHGRYNGLGPIIQSVRQFTLVLADGSVATASPEQNRDLFMGAIGGMGGLGVISTVTLALTDNINVERSRTLVPASGYTDYFYTHVRGNANVVFHNGDIYPPDYTLVSAVNWTRTDKPATTIDRLIPREQDYLLERVAMIVTSEWPFGRRIRQHIIDPLRYAGTAPVHSRNFEASHDTAELEPSSRAESTYVLQEYFIPVGRFDDWVPRMRRVFAANDVNVINVSIRHATADPGANLAWARGEVFAFVVYYKQGTDAQSRNHVASWTRALIDEAIALGGSYYLPYQPHASVEQFRRAYPQSDDFFASKRRYDPADKFTNSLWDMYYPPH